MLIYNVLEPISKIHSCCNDDISDCKPLIPKLFLIGLHGFRSKIPHFAAKAIFEMGSADNFSTKP